MKNLILSKTGFILFMVLCITLVIIMIIVPLMVWSTYEFTWTTRSFKLLRALNLADAGAELAVWEIAHNDAKFTGWSGMMMYRTLTLNSFTDNFGETSGDISVSAENTSPDHYFITSTGSILAGDTTLKRTVKVKVFPHPLFNNGIFGNDSVKITGDAYIDSYNSLTGPYLPGSAGDNGDVGTNGVLTLSGSGTVDGDIFIGPNGSVVGDISTYVSGEDYYSGNDVELEEAPFESTYFISLGSEGTLTVGGKETKAIPSKDYRFESIAVDGQATLTISSNTRIYIHNDFIIAGQATVFTGENVEIYIGGNGDFAGQGIVNTTGVPSNLIIYGINEGTNINFTGQSDFYGTIYAPYSSVYMAGDANCFGALVGDNVELAGGIKFHFDEALLTEGPSVGYDIAYWQED